MRLSVVGCRIIVVSLTFATVTALTACGRDVSKITEVAHGAEDIQRVEQSAQKGFATTDVLAATTPSYDCSATLNSSIEELICKDESLAALDRQMAEIYAAAGKTQKAQQDTYFKASQRGWIKGRNDCWKAEDKKQCVVGSYQQRMLELQLHYELVPATGSAVYLCGDQRVSATYYATEPPAALARYNGEESILTVTRSASGSHYVGRNESIWEHQGEATIVWGYGSPEMQCKVER